MDTERRVRLRRCHGAACLVPSDPRLLERFRAGDQETLEAVYWDCVDHVTTIASAVLRACSAGSARGTGEVAAAIADVVQEVFAKAFAPDARCRFDATRPYQPYLAQITRNVAVDHSRQMYRYLPSDLEQLIDRLSLEAENQDAADQWSDPQTIALVNRYVASLDDETRRVHDALYVRGLSQREAAAHLRLGRQVIRTKEAKLRRGLRKEISQAARGDIHLPPAPRRDRLNFPNPDSRDPRKGVRGNAAAG